MADLFKEIETRMRVARAYNRWSARRPWRWLPARLRPLVWRLFVERELRALDG